MSRAIRASPSRSAGIVWVCSSRTICRRCSTIAQDDVSLVELVARRLVDPAFLGQSCASISRVSVPRSSRIAPAGDQLLCLHEELDLADAAAARA